MAKKKIENMSFEEAVSELETIVNELERGDLPLEESMTLFERGLKLSQCSQTKLTDAEQKIEILINQMNQQTLIDFQDSGKEAE